jgi:hypothetical protein
LSVSQTRAHTVILHWLVRELWHASHWHLSHLAVEARHLRLLITRAVLHAVARAASEWHTRVEVLSVPILRSVLRYVREALVLARVGQVRRLKVRRELMSMRHRSVCRVRCVHR